MGTVYKITPEEILREYYHLKEIKDIEKSARWLDVDWNRTEWNQWSNWSNSPSFR